MTTILQTTMLNDVEVKPQPIAVRASALAANDHVLSRQRSKIGRVEIDWRSFPKQRPVSVTPTEAMVHVIVPLAGHAIIVGNSGSFTLTPGEALLLAGFDKTTCVWVAGSRAVLLHIPRASVQAVASRAFGDARRLGAIDCRFDFAPEELDDESVGRPNEARILETLVCALRATAQEPALFPLARSVQRAVDQVRANPVLAWTIEDLAALAGVTPGTLRRNFGSCLGMSVTQLILQLRIEWVRARLESVVESRSIGELSIASGFGASGMLNRTYQRHFGETPSQTRARAFRSRRD